MSRIYLWGNLYYADKVEVKSRLIETDGAQTAQAKIGRLTDTVRQTAHESAETLALLAIAGLLGFDWYQLFQMESSLPIRIARGIVFIVALVILMATLYLFPVLARFEVTKKQLVRNAVSFGIMNFTYNLVVIAIILAGFWLMGHALPVLPVIVAVLPPLVIWLMSRLCVKTFSKVEVSHGKDDL